MPKGPNVTNQAPVEQLKLSSYIIGFLLSLLLTACSYLAATGVFGLESEVSVVTSLAIFAALQLLVQLHYFLHLRFRNGSQWNVLAFIFMIIILLIVVGGSIWIMNNLNYNMMQPHEIDQYMYEEAQKGF